MSDSIERRVNAAWEKQNYLEFVVGALKFNREALVRLQSEYPTPRALRAASKVLRRVEDWTAENFRVRLDLDRDDVRARERGVPAPDPAPSFPRVLPENASVNNGTGPGISAIERLKHFRELRKRIEASIQKTNDDREHFIETLGAKAFSKIKQTWHDHMGFLVERIDETLEQEKGAELDVILWQLLQFDRGQGLHVEIQPSIMEQAAQVVAEALHGAELISPFVPIVLGKDDQRKLAALLASGFLLQSPLRGALAPDVNHSSTFRRDAPGLG